MQIPSLGRIVLAVCPQAKSNGADVAPAIITRVWGEHQAGGWTVNVMVLPDSGTPVAATSVRLFEDEEAARANGFAAYWPPRVG